MQQSLQDRLLYRWQCMKDRRESFEDHWRELAKFFWPRAYRWLDEEWTKRGNKANKAILDPTGTLSLRAMEAAFTASVIPSSRPWKKLRVPGDLGKSHAVKVWLEETDEIMNASILDSNFYQEGSKLFAQTGLFGTGCMLIEEDEDEDFICETLPVGSYWLGTDHRRRVNQFCREIEMTATQMAEQFGYDNLRTQMQSAIDRSQGHKETAKVLHFIIPNNDYSADQAFSSFPFVSIYIDPADNRKDWYLSKGGYEEFPVVTPRWKVMSDDVYGLDSPGMIALAHVKELQHIRKQAAKALEKMVSPPTQRPEGSMRKGVDVTPSADNVVSRGGAASDGIKPLYQINFDIQGANLHIDDLRSQIRETFFYNLFLMVASERRSNTKAREIDELHEEKMIMLSTVYEQFSHEFLDPSVERIYGILWRRGKLPVPPAEMQGQRFDVEYVSVMANAMKLVGIGNMDRALAIIGQVASIDPTVLDIFSTERFAQNYWDRLGVDARIMSSPDELQSKKDQRAAAQQQAQMQQTAVVQAETAKVLSDAKTDEDNALTQMIGRTIG